MRVHQCDEPVAEAHRHLERLSASAGVGHLDIEVLAGARPTWPVWPQPALSSLVGRPAAVLERLGLRWLHRFEATVAALHAEVAGLGGPIGGPSGLSLLVERAVMLGHHGWGSWSAGTSCRMIEAADGWLAVNLPRVDDLEAVPAWLDVAADGSAWSLVERELPSRGRAGLIERAELLGLAVGEVPPADALPSDHAPLAIGRRGPWRGTGHQPVVVDLSSLWAGPLTGWYLARTGARVRKVESIHRPDGARKGTPAFYRRLNDGKELIQVDVTTASGVAALRELIDSADIVIEASRPRALAAFGVDRSAVMDRGAIWCTITGHAANEVGDRPGRIAFGDDAAAQAGLVTYVADEPWFLGDAAADPIAGVTAALGAVALWRDGTAGHVEVAMVDAVANLTDGIPVPSSESLRGRGSKVGA